MDKIARKYTYEKAKATVQKNYVPIIIGVGIAGIAGFLLYRSMKTEKTPVTLQWFSTDEDAAADVVKDAINPNQSLKGWMDVRTITQPLIVVGASQANPVYGDLVNLGIMPEILANDVNGHIYVRQYSGQTVYGVVGWLGSQTMAAAQYIAANGLPTSDVLI